MINNARNKRINVKIVYTVGAVLLLCLVVSMLARYYYKKAENDSFDLLHVQTQQFKSDIKLQMLSDQENLVTMSRLAAKLYENGEGFNIIINSYKSIGLIDNIGVLMPDNTFITKTGVTDLNGKVSFQKECLKGTYISGRVNDFTNEATQIIRSSAPVIVKGETVAILYGSTSLNTLKRRYLEKVEMINAQLYVIDGKDGDFIIDTVNHDGRLGSFSNLKSRKYKSGYSFEKMQYDIENNNSGFTAFVSETQGVMLYMHYSPVEMANWYILLAQPESKVFSEARASMKVLMLSTFFIGLILIIYLLAFFGSERKITKLNFYASKIRKLLLEINQHHSNLTDALESITVFSEGHSTFFVDTDGEDYNYIMPSYVGNSLTGDEKREFILALMRIASKKSAEKATTLISYDVVADAKLLKNTPKLYNMMVSHDIKRVCFTTIADNKNSISLIAVLNPKNRTDTRALLEEITICFSIAIYNKKYLNKTEIAASTDALTGVLNRASYKKDILRFDEQMPENFMCIYVDVNELHIQNSMYGHAAGDTMLIYIANTLKEVFFGHKLYRIGGDEFLVFAKNVKPESISEGIEMMNQKLDEMNYHVAVGTSFRSKNIDTEEMIREAEMRMYEEKASYYQHKETEKIQKDYNDNIKTIETGIEELDKSLEIMSKHYRGIYKVSLKTDKVRRILMPAYLSYNETEDNFSKILYKYITESVNPDFHRVILNFLNYDVLKRQIMDGKIPRITYNKINGESAMLSVYSLNDNTKDCDETLWFFENV